MSAKRSIPGNRYQTFGPIYADTTVEALQAHLTKIIQGQAANQRDNALYRDQVYRLRRAIRMNSAR